MGIDIPNLDKHTFETLLEDAISKLPSRAPAWTDYNLSDPGITLIELFAWLNDINSYRLNRISNEHQEAFLKIVNPNTEENIAAKVLLSFTSGHDIARYNKDNGIELLSPKKVISVPKGTVAYQQDIRFVTQDDFLLYPIDFEIISVISKEYGKEKELPQKNFYPFAKTYENQFYFIIQLSHLVSETFSFYVDMQKYSDEILEQEVMDEILEWFYFDDENKKWEQIQTVQDGSNGFHKSGIIKLKLDTSTSKIKCLLKDKKFYETAPFIHRLMLNSVSAIQEDFHEIFLGESNGFVNQSYKLDTPLKQGSLKVKVGSKYWSEVQNLKTQKFNAEVFQVKRSHIIFGDGQYGKIPPKDLDIHCQYLRNAGNSGNVRENSLWRVDKIKSYRGSVVVQNSEAAFGGKDKPTNQELLEGFQKSLHSIERAVSLEDYEYLALHTADTQLEKVKAYVSDLNEVTLILVPKSEDPRPQASSYTQKKVKKYIDTKRLLTTALKIQEASYINVNLTMTIFSEKQNPSTLQKRIESTLDAYLHPISGGKNSQGWSFGEDLYLSSLYSLLSGVEGIDNIESLKINGTTDGKLNVNEEFLISSGTYDIKIHGLNPVVCRI